MKLTYIYVALLGIIALSGSCKKEEQPVASEDLKIPELFAPPENADPKVKSIYKDYGVWIRMDFNSWKEVTNGILGNDPYNRYGVKKIDDDQRQNAIAYTQSLLSNVSEKYAKSFLPLELFYVKSYDGGYFARDLMILGRSRLVITWPNQMNGALPVTDPVNHYYRDSTLTKVIWLNLGSMITPRMDKPIEGFEKAGKAYDNGRAFDNIMDEYYKDYDQDKKDAAMDELARTGGFIKGSGSRSFETDFPDWIALMATESYANIKARYLDNNERRTNKYNILIKFFNSYGWDIQAAGNKYREKLDAFSHE